MLCYVILCYVNIILVRICERYSLILSFNDFMKLSILCFKLTNMHVRCVQVLMRECNGYIVEDILITYLIMLI